MMRDRNKVVIEVGDEAVYRDCVAIVKKVGRKNLILKVWAATGESYFKSNVNPKHVEIMVEVDNLPRDRRYR